MRITTGAMLIQASSLWSRFSVADGSLRCHWTLSEVRLGPKMAILLFLVLMPRTGLLVSVVILQQGLAIFKGAFWEMTDASAPEPIIRSLSHSLDKLLEDPHLKTSVLHMGGLRARRAGSHLFVNLSIGVPGDLSALQLDQLEKRIVAALKADRKDVKEVHVQFEVTSGSNGQASL
jgi:divalent metal cation (Fe/Co/Zn/Cd) transporter